MNEKDMEQSHGLTMTKWLEKWAYSNICFEYGNATPERNESWRRVRFPNATQKFNKKL